MRSMKSKSALYIQKLDEARNNGDWSTVPELIRKTKKHAPERACLTLTAESEYMLAQEIQHLIDITHPHSTVTTISSSNSPGISKYTNLLADAIEKENAYAEDKYQAQVCLGSIHWHLGESTLAIANLPKNIKGEFSQIESTSIESPKCMRLCAIKASYIKGALLQKEGESTAAIIVFHSALPILSNVTSCKIQGNEVRLWTELYLTGVCTLSSDFLKKNFSSDLMANTLSAFRFWARFWDNHASKPVGDRVPLTNVTRRYVWKEYLITLSNLFHQGLLYPTDSLSTSSHEVSTKLQQSSELNRVEAHYESLLMTEIHFPKADEASLEVENFVEVIMNNWRIRYDSSLQYQDIGEDGAEAISRSVLEILYRAAKKTFHSTAILRHLFTVHLAIAEFDLAFKIFDTYVVIVMKGKSRLDKTGQKIEGLDDDDTVLRVASEYIKALCRDGSYELSKKAYKTSQFFESWLENRNSANQNGKKNTTVANSTSTLSSISPETFALIWRCIGIGYAQWARATFDAASRSEVQSKAIECFNKALLPQYQSSNNPETLFALGLLFAERRQLDAAIKVLKNGLLSTSSNDPTYEYAYGYRNFTKGRLAIPLWHLMALLLSARQEFLLAVKSCEGAYERFNNQRHNFCEGVSNESEKISTNQDQSLKNEMDNFEKENLIQVKMTQLTLIEVLEGPDVAINESHKLVNLYSNLFSNPRTDQILSDYALLPVPPKSSAGKSFRESILNCSIRKAHDSFSGDQNSPLNAPIIHITSDSSKERRRRSLTVSAAHFGEKLKGSSTSHSKKIENTNSHSNYLTGGRKRSQSGDHSYTKPDTLNQDQLLLNTKMKNHRCTSSISVERPASGNAAKINARILPSDVTDKRNEKSVEHTPVQENYNPEAPKTSLRFNPATILSKKEQKRHKITILVNIWLLISGFYRRASMYDDAQGAIDEARQLVNLIESDELIDSDSPFSANKSKWQEGKTVAELWSDVYSELGYLAIAEGSPHTAILQFETALTHFRDHRDAIVGLSNILMDIYTEKILLPPSIPDLNFPTSMTLSSSSLSILRPNPMLTTSPNQDVILPINSTITQDSLDLAEDRSDKLNYDNYPRSLTSNHTSISAHEINYKDPSPALLNRLAARDRAFGLLIALTKTGLGWNHSEAWFALARAYEESDQIDRAKEVLWWCVELENGRGIRDWTIVNNGGYVL